MNDRLLLDINRYEVRTQTEDALRITYRVYPNVTYVADPVCPEYQTMSIYVPEPYYHGESIHGWTAKTAPIFLPNHVGAYAAAAEDAPGRSQRGFNKGQINAAFMALYEGFVVACPAARGRGAVDDAGRFVGAAPAGLVDLKAAIRYLRHNAGRIPGCTERIISNGTSAGGAMSALLASTGDSTDYTPYLQAIGAAEESDAIYAASCYCPITNLDHADMAYEWLLKGYTSFTSVRMIPVNGRVEVQKYVGELSEEQLVAGEELRSAFIDYVNQLQLKTTAGEVLMLDEDGEGSFRDYVTGILEAGARKAIAGGMDLSDKNQVLFRDGQPVGFDLEEHVRDVGRMKPVPAFDEWAGHSPENEVFGSAKLSARHFTAFGAAHDTAGLEQAPEELVRLMNPMDQLQVPGNVSAAHVRIRHGSHDPHTSWAIPTLLAETMRSRGIDVDYALEWGKPHSGDYDLRELFDWIEKIC